MSRIAALLLLGPMAIFAVSGCSTVEYVPVTPQCTVPPHPVMPLVDMGEVWDSAGDGLFRDIETYVNNLWALVDEQNAIIEAICSK
ncbi:MULTISPECIES: hypothetical protein [unclassified Halomonas]|uniref:hypothetical protein n=1 Tax=unclassified Halomonas TaxID=2609666 RepID=UPI002076B26A|nr:MULTISPECIES: hypothetical protein [unclassified Halomonas]